MSTRGRRLAAAVLDAVTYALTAAVVVTLAAALISFPLGQGLFGVVYLQFIVALLCFGFATLVSWPGSAWQSPNLSFDVLFGGGREEDDETVVPWVDLGPTESSGDPDQTPFQALVQRLPPARFLPTPPSQRLPTGLRLYLAAFTIAAISYWLNVHGGVTA